jgi:hypothetical protein
MDGMGHKIAIFGIILATFGTPLGLNFDLFETAKGPNWLFLMVSTQIKS